ncbi:hypothetical protein [Actinosynnema sp. NPDC020468]|uniref:hypothetical protein n=1 Tax=Actinosynnema sp. NPDC020468 TaxID=3154488 RepID=UPI003401093E
MDLADATRRVSTLNSKLNHPSTQVLDAGQHGRLKEEVQALYWAVRERVGGADWRGLHSRVADLIKRVDLLDPSRDQDVFVPHQVREPRPAPDRCW